MARIQVPVRAVELRIGSAIPALLALIVLSGGCQLDLSDPYVNPSSGDRTVPTAGYQCFAALNGDDDSLRIHFIDVGQGDGIWIQTPDDFIDGNGEKEGYNIIIDTGRTPVDEDPNGTGHVIIDYLADHGELAGAEIDFLVITHAHSDHYGGAIEIMNAYDVVNILDPGFDNDSNSTYTAYLNRAATEVAENGGQLYRPVVGTLVTAEYQEIDIFGDEIITRVLNSEANLRLGEGVQEQLNNTAIALSMEYQGVDVLFMADCHDEVEFDIVDYFESDATPNLRTNILKVGHHGSTSSSTAEFLALIFNDVPISQRFAVIQSGTRSFGGTTLPAQSTVDRILEYVPPEAFFSTQIEDDDKDESEAPGDDHVQAVISANGQIDMCYAPNGADTPQ